MLHVFAMVQFFRYSPYRQRAENFDYWQVEWRNGGIEWPEIGVVAVKKRYD